VAPAAAPLEDGIEATVLVVIGNDYVHRVVSFPKAKQLTMTV
jgi:hypothetical protein